MYLEQRKFFTFLNGLASEKFESTFNRVSHIYNTRGNNRILTLPKVKSENGRKSFEFSGAKLFNNLRNRFM